MHDMNSSMIEMSQCGLDSDLDQMHYVLMWRD